MIREFTGGDFRRCREIVNEVWNFTGVFKPDRLADLFLDAYAGGSLSESNCAIVLEENGTVEGFLFGKCGNAKTIRRGYPGATGNLGFLWRLLSLAGVPWKEKLNYISMLNEHERNRHRAERRRDNEVQLFAVTPAAQGKGYGKALMEAYIRECRKRNVKRVTLDTDKECNFRFYERFGYRRIAEFHSPVQKLYTGNDGSCFVYELLME